MIKKLPERFGVDILDYVIMPNHIHLIINIPEKRAIRESPLCENRSLISKTVGYFKVNTSKQIHDLMPDIEVWQRSYYDHIIRDEADYTEKAGYIQNNPLRWAEDEYYNNV